MLIDCWRWRRQVGAGSGTKLDDDTSATARPSGTAVSMQRGDALIFYSLHEDGSLLGVWRTVLSSTSWMAICTDVHMYKCALQAESIKRLGTKGFRLKNRTRQRWPHMVWATYHLKQLLGRSSATFGTVRSGGGATLTFNHPHIDVQGTVPCFGANALV